MEISMLGSLKHKNLVSIVGFCDEKDEKVIINMNETRGWLDTYLSDSMLLTWVRRLEICVGLAHALSYIHHDEPRDFSVIHRNIDSLTVQLNNDWEPKLSNFERSLKIKASQRHQSFHTNVVEYTNGHGDPTYIETKRVHHKSDMYSFGIVLCEVLCGRRSIITDDINKYLAPLAITHYREKKLNEIIDWDLWKQMDSQSCEIFAEIAYDCLNEKRWERPSIDEIVPRLKKALELQLERQNAILSLPSKELAHLKVPLENILSATNNFAEENIICSYSFCKEYKGQLFWSGELINIIARRLNKERDDEDDQQFWMEISMLSTLKHKNLISLVAFCDEKDEKVIINRHATRGRLDNYLSNPMYCCQWVRRLEICVSLAHALSYIHYDELVTRLEKALELQLAPEIWPIMSSPKDLSYLKVPLENIVIATNNFAEANLFSTSGFAQEYKGQLVWSGELINVTARRLNKVWKQGEQQFWMEIFMLSSLKHKNLVSIVGFCDESDEKIIIINRNETKGWLNDYLCDPMLLTWVEDWSGTLLLYDDWEPKLSNFERSMMIKASQRHNSFHNETLHYTDIHSFGIVLFELLCARRAIIVDEQDNKYLDPVGARLCWPIFPLSRKILNDIMDPIYGIKLIRNHVNLFAKQRMIA
ncbi:kinase-like domain, phloem protein 2-like protein [Tanacetum coccineum]